MATWYPYALVALLFLAGCAGDAPETAPNGALGFDGSDAAYVVGRVVDVEIVPLEGVAVSADERVAMTDQNGTFRLGPFESGQVVMVTAEKEGYAPGTVEVLATADGTDMVLITIVPMASSVPYYETIPHVAFIDCAWAGPPGSLPCNPIDRQLGTNFTNDQSQWFFSIPGPNVAALLHEAVWAPSPWGRDMRFLLFHPDLVSGSAVGGDPYLDSRSGSPDRSWLIPGEESERAAVPFNGNESFLYQALYRPWTTNSTIPGWGLAVQQRVENFYTFFYHREGREDFTVLPDQ